MPSLPRLGMPAVHVRAAARRALTGHTRPNHTPLGPASHCLQCSTRHHPANARLTQTVHAGPHLSLPAFPYITAPGLARPGTALPCLPSIPVLACRSWQLLTTPGRALPHTTRTCQTRLACLVVPVHDVHRKARRRLSCVVIHCHSDPYIAAPYLLFIAKPDHTSPWPARPRSTRARYALPAFHGQARHRPALQRSAIPYLSSPAFPSNQCYARRASPGKAMLLLLNFSAPNWF